MSGALLNGYPVVAARAFMPLVGAWTADVYVDTAVDVTGAAVLAFDGGLELHGYARRERGGVHLDALHLRLVGGAGGLRTVARPTDYRDCPLRLPLAALLDGAGEALAGTSDAGVLGTQLERWTVAAQPTGLALAALLACVPAASWRVLASGQVWIGPETWPAATFDGLADEQLVDDDHQDASALWYVPAPTLTPGTTIADQDGNPRRVSDVEHIVAPDRTQTRTWYAGDRPRGLRGTMAAVLRAAFPRIDYLARYDGVIQAQSADGRRVDVRLDDTTRWGDGLSSVPLRLGLPGCKALIEQGARVLVGWDGADPRRPYAEAFPGGEGVTLIRVEGNAIEVIGGPNADVTISTSGTGSVNVTASPVTGAVKLGPNPIAAPLVQGALDSMGVPVTQLPAAALSIVRSG